MFFLNGDHYVCIRCKEEFRFASAAMHHDCIPDRQEQTKQLQRAFNSKWQGVNQNNKAYQRAWKALQRQLDVLIPEEN